MTVHHSSGPTRAVDGSSPGGFARTPIAYYTGTVGDGARPKMTTGHRSVERALVPPD